MRCGCIGGRIAQMCACAHVCVCVCVRACVCVCVGVCVCVHAHIPWEWEQNRSWHGIAPTPTVHGIALTPNTSAVRNGYEFFIQVTSRCLFLAEFMITVSSNDLPGRKQEQFWTWFSEEQHCGN